MKNKQIILSRIAAAMMFLLLTSIVIGCSVKEQSESHTSGNTTETSAQDETVPDDIHKWLTETDKYDPSDVERTYKEDDDVSALINGMITAKPEKVLLECGEQLLALSGDSNGYSIITYLSQTNSNGKYYVPMFDAGKSIFSTSHINLVPNEYRTGADEKGEYVIFSGEKEGISFSYRITALKEYGIFKFEVTVTPSWTLTMKNLSVGLFMIGKPEVVYEQGPTSIYLNAASENFGIGMPAAYLWDRGREAVIYFDYSDMTWLGTSTLLPNRMSRITDIDFYNGMTGFGLATINSCMPSCSQQMVFNFYLYSGFSGERTGLDCIKRKVEVMAPLHPISDQIPTLRSDISDAELSWTYISDGTAKSLLNSKAFSSHSLNITEPIISMSKKRQNKLYVTYARQSDIQYSFSDFSCMNNFLSAFNLYNRLNPDDSNSDYLEKKMNALQFFYDPECHMIRWGIRINNQVGDFEMPWQNFFYNIENYRASMSSSDENFNVASMANMLSSIEGVTELVQNSNYLLGQFSDPYNKIPATQQDVPDLKYVYEPWQIGSYAYVLTKAYDMTGDSAYIDTAAESLRYVIEDLRYSVETTQVTREYHNSAEFPITELFGLSYGTAAAYRIFEITGNEAFLTYSEQLLASLLQLTFWYDDNMSAPSLTMNMLGLFEPHGGALHSCPWETIEAYLPLTEILNSTGNYSFNDLLLKLFNLERVNSYYYYPLVWDEYFSSQMAYYQSDFYCIPTEPLYNTFGGGNSDYGALYMSGISFWNYLMYEAFGGCSDSDVMALNTDVMCNIEPCFASAKRNFILYNSKSEDKSFTFSAKNLKSGSYTITVTKDGNTETFEYTSEKLSDGIAFTLSGYESIRITMTLNDGQVTLADANMNTMTRYSLGYAYYLLREKLHDIAEENLNKIYPDASEEDIDTVAEYVGTLMSYDDAMAHALGNYKSVKSLKSSYIERKYTTATMRNNYKNAAEYHLPDTVNELQEKMSSAYSEFNSGNIKQAYDISQQIIDALKS